MRTSRSRSTVALAALVLLSSACGGDTDDGATGSTNATGATTSTSVATSAPPTGPPETAPGTPPPTAPSTTALGATTSSTEAAAPDAPSTTAAPARTFSPVPAGATVEIVASGLVAPWDIAFAPDGRAFVSERDSGQISVIEPSGELRPVATVPISPPAEAGLLGLAVSPTFAEDGWLYAYHTTEADNRVVRLRPDADPVATEAVLTGIPRGPIHDGGRIAFGPDSMLYVATGDAGVEATAQDLGSLGGKVLRVTPDGDVPPGNPFDSPVWAYGLRNVQGLAWDERGRLWATQFGPNQDDELNLIEPGANYGWPEVTGDSGGRFTDPALLQQPPESSPSGLAFVSGDNAWRGDLVFAALRGERLWKVTPTDDGGVVDVQPLFVGAFGRLRAVAQAPDGSLWLATNNRDGRGAPRAGDDLIVRVVPPPA